MTWIHPDNHPALPASIPDNMNSGACQAACTASSCTPGPLLPLTTIATLSVNNYRQKKVNIYCIFVDIRWKIVEKCIADHGEVEMFTLLTKQRFG
jgi:hypothetical protein